MDCSFSACFSMSAMSVYVYGSFYLPQYAKIHIAFLSNHNLEILEGDLPTGILMEMCKGPW